jgi:glycosyltransferase involved in cell wall biosynthesis
MASKRTRPARASANGPTSEARGLSSEPSAEMAIDPPPPGAESEPAATEPTSDEPGQIALEGAEAGPAPVAQAAIGLPAAATFPYEIELDLSAPLAVHAPVITIDCRFRHFHQAPIELRPGEPGEYSLGFRLFDLRSRALLAEGRMAPDETPIAPGSWSSGKLHIPREKIPFGGQGELMLDMMKEDEFSFAASPAEAKRFTLRFPPLDHTVALPSQMPGLNGQMAREIALDRPAGAPPAGLPARRAAEAARARYHLVFDVSDLAQYFHKSRLPTGIQRVQMQIITSVLAALPDGFSVQLACFAKFADFWSELPAAFFQRLCHMALASGDVAAADWQQAVVELKAKVEHGPPLAFAQGAFLINLGTSWWLQNYFLNLRTAKARYGVRYVPYVHDCIPIVTPEHCTAELTRDFITWAAGVFQHADHIAVNSRATAADVVRVARYLGHDIAEPAVVRLDAEYRRAGGRPLTQDMGAFLRHELRPGSYVLFVSTVESRKNHLLAFSAWLGLIKKHGIARVPRLVCVGNHGWLNDAIYAKLGASKLLQEKVVMLSKIPDAALQFLYENCLFTLFPSAYEGWGLPVTESLCCGKVPLVSNCSALPEAGGAFAEYFDLASEAEFVAKLERLIFDAEYRVARERKIAAEFRPRSWTEIGTELLDLVRRWSVEVPTPHRPYEGAAEGIWPFEAELGRYYGLTENLETRIWPGMVSGEIYRQGNGWWWPEPWGTRAKAGLALLAFFARLGETDGAMLFLGVRGNQGSACTATITVSGVGTREVRLDPDQDRWIRFRISAEGLAKLGVDGKPPLFEVLFSADMATDYTKTTEGKDQRVASIGVQGFMICAEDDVRSRLRFIESVSLRDLAGLEDKPFEAEYLM